MVTAAVLHRQGEPVVLEEIELAAVGARQVRVEMVATGVCRSDLYTQDGTRPHPVPVVLGHEGAGIVRQVGSDVRGLREGDSVLLANSPPCGACWYCKHSLGHLCVGQVDHILSLPYGALRSGQALMPSMGLGTFATETLVVDTACIRIPNDVPLETAAVISCAVATGAGAVLCTAGVGEGNSVVVVGCGGVGMSAILAARAVGASPIFAVDPVADRRAAALSAGADASLDPTVDDVMGAIRRATGGRGSDFAFEAYGSGATIELTYQCIRRGGMAVVIGASSFDESVTLSAFDLFDDAKTLVGCQSGNAPAATTFPHLVNLWREGHLPVELLISGYEPLHAVNEALDDLRAGRGLRTVLLP